MDTAKEKLVLVLGASTKVNRYSNKAMKALTESGYSFIALGREIGKTVYGVQIIGSIEDIPKQASIDTVTVYLNEVNQNEYHDKILALRPRRVIFNPGAENHSLYLELKRNNIEVLNACSLVMLSIDTF